MKNSVKVSLTPVFVVFALAGLWCLGMLFYFGHNSKDTTLIVNTGDEIHQIGPDKVTWGTILEIKSFDGNTNDDVLVVRIKIAKTAVEHVGYMVSAEGVKSGEHVIVHNLAHRDNHGWNYIYIVTKAPDSDMIYER